MQAREILILFSFASKSHEPTQGHNLTNEDATTEHFAKRHLAQENFK